MKESSEYVQELASPDGDVKIRIGSRVQILEKTGWTSKELTYPYEDIVTSLIEEWDNGERGGFSAEDWGFNMITLGEHTFYPNEKFSNIKVIIY